LAPVPGWDWVTGPAAWWWVMDVGRWVAERTVWRALAAPRLRQPLAYGMAEGCAGFAVGCALLAAHVKQWSQWAGDKAAAWADWGQQGGVTGEEDESEGVA
jgi:hypothetical protein